MLNIPVCLGLLISTCSSTADEPSPRTTLDNPDIKYAVVDGPYVVLERGPVQAVVVDNQAVDDRVLIGHRAGYSGVASLTHREQPRNIFVPAYAGLNFEHIHDGTNQPRDILFEPRHAPMQLRRINEHTVELYQPATPHWGLESCQRYQLLEDGALEMTVECIPRRRAFARDTFGLFWASYIDQPESLDIHFLGRGTNQIDGPPRWIRGVTPSHGSQATHVAIDDQRKFDHDEDFPLSLVFNRSKYNFAEPWYFGVSHGMALVYMFRPQDKVRITQSPSGGGRGNPAWDFQFLFKGSEVGRRYQMVIRAQYVPYESSEQIRRISEPHRRALRE